MNTPVIVRTWRNAPKTPIAFLPTCTAAPGRMLSYERIGQHGEANYQMLQAKTRPATDAETADMVAHLSDLYQEPVIAVQRDQQAYRDERWAR